MGPASRIVNVEDDDAISNPIPYAERVKRVQTSRRVTC